MESEQGKITPSCPACGAKFSHDLAKACCKRCGLPDEVVAEGHQAIAHWKRKPWTITTQGGIAIPVKDKRTKRQMKLTRTAGRQRRRNKHGRTHA